jgi:hypothetical protein
LVSGLATGVSPNGVVDYAVRRSFAQSEEQATTIKGQ